VAAITPEFATADILWRFCSPSPAVSQIYI